MLIITRVDSVTSEFFYFPFAVWHFLFYYVNVKYSNCFQFILQILVTTETTFCFRIPESLQRWKIFTCENFWFECVYSFMVLYHAYDNHKNLENEFHIIFEYHHLQFYALILRANVNVQEIGWNIWESHTYSCVHI